MENIICDTSALLFWRTPPLARLIAAGPEDDELLCHLFGAARLRSLRADLADCSVLRAQARAPMAWHAHYGARTGALLDADVLLATSFAGPVDVLVESPEGRRPSEVVRPRVWGPPLLDGDAIEVAPGLLVASPELALQQVAPRASLERTAMLASELCGSFSVYQPPAPLADALQGLADDGLLPSFGGWTAAVDNDGQLTGLWSRAPLATLASLARHAERSEAPLGRARLKEAAGLVHAGAASPFEVQTGMLVGLSRRRGGEGFADFEHNRRVALASAAARVARRRACFCDIFWDDVAAGAGLDLECQSASHHFGTRSASSDADRATALQMMGIEVLQVTYAQIASPRNFAEIARFLAERLGVSYRQKSEVQLRAQARLRRELFVDWRTLPMV